MTTSDRGNITWAERDAWLALDDDGLLAACEVDAYRASGPGGQKRNKTSSAVRLRHRPTGLIVISEESRSQHANKRTALRRLRLAMAVELRPVDAAARKLRETMAPYVMPDGRLRVSEKNVAFPRLLAAILDEVVAAGGSVREVADEIGVSASQVIRFLSMNEKALAEVNRVRQSSELPRLRRS